MSRNPKTLASSYKAKFQPVPGYSGGPDGNLLLQRYFLIRFFGNIKRLLKHKIKSPSHLRIFPGIFSPLLFP